MVERPAMPAPITATRWTGLLLELLALELVLDDNDGNDEDESESELGMLVASNTSDGRISCMVFLIIVFVIVTVFTGTFCGYFSVLKKY
jgi:hypothetical protein